jgi:2-methylaconitate cis-trans-isomerase PrpF
MEMSVRAEEGAGDLHLTGITIGRTARHILDGAVWVPSELLAAAGSAESRRVA